MTSSTDHDDGYDQDDTDYDAPLEPWPTLAAAIAAGLLPGELVKHGTGYMVGTRSRFLPLR